MRCMVLLLCVMMMADGACMMGGCCLLCQVCVWGWMVGARTSKLQLGGVCVCMYVCVLVCTVTVTRDSSVTCDVVFQHRGSR